MKSKRLYYFFLGTAFVFLASLSIFLFYIYHEGIWNDVMNYYRFFFDPKKLKSFIASYGAYAPFVFVLIQILQVLFAPIPGEVTGFVGGLLFGTFWGLFLSTIGLTLGSLIAFFFSRAFGMGFVERVVKREYIDSFNNFITHKGLSLVFILYLIPGFPKDILSYLLGLTHIRTFDFIVINLLGRLPGTFVLSLQGNALRHAEYKTLIVLVFLSVVALVILYFSRRYVGRLIGYPIHLLLRKHKDQ